MEFIHQPYQPGETIAAIATAPGEGGVAIIRISGDQAREVAARVFIGPVFTYKSHTAHYGKIVNAKGAVIDDVLLLPMLGKRSYTGEETVEIYCHGGSLISRRVLALILQAGARHALPGEFTFKAYMNGRLDLAQAEAVQELISAKNERALDAAENQLRGALSGKIQAFQQQLTIVAAILEAWVDFPDEGLEFSSMEETTQDLEKILVEMQKLHQTFHDGKILHEGLALCLVGCPNVGKSSLMNVLLDKERAIVSHVPGTTRDILEDFMRLNGLNFRILDTAGIRDTEEVIEQEGIRRTKQAMGEADLILLILDASQGLRKEDLQLMQELPFSKTLAVWNKIDLNTDLPSIPFSNIAKVSAIKRMGIEELKGAIDAIIWEKGPPSSEEVLLTSVRHHESLGNAITACRALIDGLNTGISPEFLTIEIRTTLKELGKIIGTNIGEDILSAIFSKFCIGK